MGKQFGTERRKVEVEMEIKIEDVIGDNGELWPEEPKDDANIILRFDIYLKSEMQKYLYLKNIEKKGKITNTVLWMLHVSS